MAQGELIIEQELAATPTVLWRQLTEPDSLSSWFWPARLQPVVQLDPHIGGTFRISSQPAGLAVSGLILDAATEERLLLTWSWDGEPNETQVELRLHETRPGFTRLVLSHSRHDSDVAVNDHRQGWTDCLERLSQKLEHIAAARARAEKSIMDFVAAAMDTGGLLLDENDLPADFFDLSTGLLGELFQKFSNYYLKLALVLPLEARFGERIVELVREHQEHPDLRFFSTDADARTWLSEATGQS